MLPSLSEAVPLKNTVVPFSADEGSMESMLPTGGALGWITSVVFTQADHSPSLSCTLNVMVCVPTLKLVVLKSSFVLNSPSIEDSHR